MDIYQLDPFDNELIVTKLTGSEIHSLMLTAYSINDIVPVYPSGIRIKLRKDLNGNLLEVILLTEDGNQLSMDKTYSVAMNSYMTQAYKYEHNDPGQSLFITSADALIEYLRRIKNVRSYRGEKRIQTDRE